MNDTYLNWIREYGDKLAPDLRSHLLQYYSQARLPAGILKKIYTRFLHKWHKINVIVQLEEDVFKSLSLQPEIHYPGWKKSSDIQVLGAFCTTVNFHTLKQIAADSNVKRIWYDGEIKALLDIASPAVGVKPLWETGASGKGITIAILDTGVCIHPDLADRIIFFKDYIKDRTQPYDDNGHGTHVTGCAAGNGKSSNGLYTAPAYEANIAVLKVLDKNGSGRISSAIKAIQWCIAHKSLYNIRIINMSLGSQTSLSYQEDPVCLAVEKAWEAGIVICAAAGNTGPGIKSIHSPGNHPKIITVGAADDVNTIKREDDRVAGFSSRGPTADGLAKPDLVAPGVQITALRSPGSFLDKEQRHARVGLHYFTMSGTSMAAPVCAGVVALLLEKQQNLTPDEIKMLLTATSLPLHGYHQHEQGSGLLNAAEALELLDSNLLS